MNDPYPKAPAGRNYKHYASIAILYLIAALCLFWVFYDVHPVRFLESLSINNWKWIPLAVLFQMTNFGLQGLRWKYLLQPVGILPWIKATRAVFAGQLVNGMFPMRIGELARVFLVSRWLSVDIFSAIPSISVETLFDSLWLAIAIGTIAFFVPLPLSMQNAIILFGSFSLIAAGLFIFVVFWKRKASHHNVPAGSFIEKIWNHINRLFHRLLDGLQKIGLSRAFFASFFVSLLMLITQTLAFWLVMLACGLKLSVWAGVFVFLIVHLGTMIPSAPSNIGTYQFFTVLGLSLFGVDKSIAAGFSLVVFFVLTTPILLAGFFAIHSTGMTLRTVRADLGRLIGQR
jgi:glycosyltransferase 2 family protein